MMIPSTTPQQFKCPDCKYDLRGLMVGDLVRCPECGKLHTRQSLTQGDSWRLRWIFALLCLVPAVGVPLLASTMVPQKLAMLVLGTPLWLVASLGCIVLGSILFVDFRHCPPSQRGKAVAYVIGSASFFLVVDAILAFFIGMAFLESGFIHLGC